jgi:hypothetical protein
MAFSYTRSYSRIRPAWFFLKRDLSKTITLQLTIRDILHQEHSCKACKSRVYKPHLMSTREICYYIYYITTS